MTSVAMVKDQVCQYSLHFRGADISILLSEGKLKHA